MKLCLMSAFNSLAGTHKQQTSKGKLEDATKQSQPKNCFSYPLPGPQAQQAAKGQLQNLDVKHELSNLFYSLLEGT